MIDTNFTGRRSEVEKDDLDDYCEDLCNDRSLHESADIYLLDIEGGSKYCQFIFHDEYLA